MTDDGAKRLACAIIQQAMKDYRNKTTPAYERKNILEFFDNSLICDVILDGIDKKTIKGVLRRE